MGIPLLDVDAATDEYTGGPTGNDRDDEVEIGPAVVEAMVLSRVEESVVESCALVVTEPL